MSRRKSLSGIDFERYQEKNAFKKLVLKLVSKGTLLKITVNLRDGASVCISPPKAEVTAHKTATNTTIFVKRSSFIL